MTTISHKSRQPQRVAWSEERLIHERAIALVFYIDRSSSRTYTSALNSYIAFCKLHQKPIDPTPDTLSFFVVYMSHHIKPSSVDSYLSGICNQLEHHFPQVRQARNSRLVTNTLTGCKRLMGSPTTRKQPLTRAHLRTLHTHYSTSPTHDDCLFLAQIFTGFFALLRLGELTDPDNVSLRDPRKTSRRSTLILTAHDYRFLLPAHKADRFFEGNTILIQKLQSTADPHEIFSSYLTSRDNLFPYHPQLWLRANGSVPTRSWFIQRLRRHFPPSIAGQSMRAGGATSLAENGASPHIIQAAGRWASDAFLVYIRKNPFVLQGLIHGRPAHET
jgi:hypothetical protein